MSAKKTKSASVVFSADKKQSRVSGAIKAVVIAVLSVILVVTAVFAIVVLSGNEDVLLDSGETFSLVSFLSE